MQFYFLRNRVFSYALLTAFTVVARNAPISRAFTPSIVVPPGEHTLSFSSPGCLPELSTISAAPFTVSAAYKSALSLGRPQRTPPSERASMNKYTNAGPHPERALAASISFSSILSVIPANLKISSNYSVSLTVISPSQE